MEPRTQLLVGNLLGLATIISILIGIIGLFTGVLALQLFLALFLPLMMARMYAADRVDRIRIHRDGSLTLNGNTTTIETLPKDLRLDDPYLARKPSRASSAYREQLRWVVWVERAFDPDCAPDVAVELITLLQAHDVPMGCIWIDRHGKATYQVTFPSDDHQSV